MATEGKRDILLESGTNELEVLVFTLNAQRYGVNVAKVREVIEPIVVTAMPESHEAVVGVFQLREMITPLIDLKKSLGEKPSDLNAGKIVIMEFNDLRMGFLVDTVEQIYRVSWKDVAAIPDVEGVNGSPLTSIAHIEDGMVLMLDFEQIVFDIGGVDLFEQSARNVQENRSRGDQRIMLAEDSHAMRTLIHSNLKTAGYTNVTLACDGQEAWETLKKDIDQNGRCTFDILITDIEMPRIDGLHLTSKVKEHNEMKKLPVIIFSSLVSDDNKKKCAAVNADAQITKPQLDKLVSLIDGLLEKNTPKAAEAAELVAV